MHFGFALELSNVDLLNIDLLDTHLDFACLHKVFKTSSRHVFKTSSRCLQEVSEDVKLLRWRRVEDVLKTCLEDVLKMSSRPTNVCWAMILTCAKIQRKLLMFVEVGATESFFGTKSYMSIRLGRCILWILNNPRFNNLSKGQRDEKISRFAKYVKIGIFEHLWNT